jgi:hypothetical protein
MEGLYINVEQEDRVVERFKFVRADFLAILVFSGATVAATVLRSARKLDGCAKDGAKPG